MLCGGHYEGLIIVYLKIIQSHLILKKTKTNSQKHRKSK